jgi:hypothetical protein
MKPSINAFVGYTYQQWIIYFLLVKMDTEREIEEVEIEVDVSHQFDDAKIKIKGEDVFCQMKDMENVSFEELSINETEISIKNNKHSLSDKTNVLFFKNIDIKNNSQIFGIPAYEKSGLYIVSLSRHLISEIVGEIYWNTVKRESVIQGFYNHCLDSRKLIIKRNDLPIIDIYSTKLVEKTIDVGKYNLELNNIVVIEGKPGVGKSHLVNCLKNEFDNNIVYRFWTSNQDIDYLERLRYGNFLANISKEFFGDFKFRNEQDIIDGLFEEKKVIIIDGFDHVENYNIKDFDSYVTFIEKLKEKCKVILLTRPLKTKLKWKNQTLDNWNEKQTEKVLNELYHITDYKIQTQIYEITDGYPILVRFISEHYKKFGEVPQLEKLENTEDYYDKIIGNINTKSALSLFVSSRSFFMESEIAFFLEHDMAILIYEFIEAYPYLFEKKLNRFSLMHDSFNTFLRNHGINSSNLLDQINDKVYQSIMNGEKRYLSRFGMFDLGRDKKLKIIRKYTSIVTFKELSKDVVDFESIRSFYNQIREALSGINAAELVLINYYDLSLIINIVNRDHVSTINAFFYTYVKCLLFNGYSEEDITSSAYLFSMLYFIRTNNIGPLINRTSDDMYDTENFYQNLLDVISSEEKYFEKHKLLMIQGVNVQDYLHSRIKFDSSDFITEVLVNVYLNKTEIKELLEFKFCITEYIEGDEQKGITALKWSLHEYGRTADYLVGHVLGNAKSIIESLGYGKLPNDFQTLSLNEIIIKNWHVGSFTMWVLVLNYMRLSLFEKRKIDLSSIGLFWLMYHERKDYSVIEIDTGLTVFEKEGFVSELDSLRIIIYTQKMSEKGIRHLLTDYIKLHSTRILSQIERNFELNDLNITWFKLPQAFINCFSDELFSFALRQFLRTYSYSRKIDINDIQNTYKSNWWKAILRKIELFQFRIEVKDTHPLAEELKEKYPDLINVLKDEDKSTYSEDSLNRYNRGRLTDKDKGFIIERNLSIAEVAGYANDYYSVLANLEIYDVFTKEDIQNNIHLVLRNAILGKTKDFNLFYNLYHLPGTIPKLIFDNDTKVNRQKFFQSFMTFMELSFLKITS